MRKAAVRTERTQTCISCGATIHLPKSREPLLCFRCRATFGARVPLGERGVTPGGALFQRITSPERSSSLNVRTTGLLFALFLVVAAFAALRGRGAVDSAEGTAAPSSSQDRHRNDGTSRQGGVNVILVGPEHRSSK